MSELPNNWTTARLGDLAEDISYGYTAPSTREKIGPHLLRITDIQENEVLWNSVPYCEIDSEQTNKYLLKENDLVFARTGATVGKSFLIKGEIPDAVFASYLIRVRCIRPEAACYLSLYFRSQDYWRQITGFSAGIGQPNVNGSKLKELVIPLPPLAEQTRIAAKLDELLAQVDTLMARIDGIPALLKRFRQSVLAAAVSGRLTEEWRTMHTHRPALTIEELEVLLRSSGFKSKAKGIAPAESSIVPGWLDAPLGAVLTVRSGDGLTAKEMDDSGTIPVYGGNGVNGYHTEGNVRTRTVVIGRVGYYCGSVHFTPNEAWITDNALIVSFPNTVFDVNYIYWLLLGTNLRKNTSSSAQPVISGEKIYPINLSIPPLTEQTEIVRHVEQLFAFADQLETRVKAAQARINCLTQSILAKAYRGELVPQDPNDEPARVLLERIKAQHAATPKTKRGRRSATAG